MSKKDKLDIIYEDKMLLVVNKPSGLLTISTEKEKEKTLFHKVFEYIKKKNKNNKIFILHRLDKDTSGIVMFCKDQKLKFLIQNNWDKLVKLRQYVAVVEGVPPKEKDSLKSWLSESKTLKTYSTNKKEGHLAITNYRLISSNNGYSLLEIEIKTGRKNQIRVQLSDEKIPIIGDKKYGSKKNPINRLGLHANKIIFINPVTRKEMVFETDIPNWYLFLIIFNFFYIFIYFFSPF